MQKHTKKKCDFQIKEIILSYGGVTHNKPGAETAKKSHSYSDFALMMFTILSDVTLTRWTEDFVLCRKLFSFSFKFLFL